jgi:23S rRNA pseudouridine1911/1915/1917 synthase
MEILYQDNRILVCLKPTGVRSTDEPGGVPELLREQLGDPTACIRTVHRLDQVVGGVMVLARSRKAAQLLSRQMQSRAFEKEYLAVVHGTPPEAGTLKDLLYRDTARRRTLVAAQPGKGVQEAVLDYRVLEEREGLSLVSIRLHTGRTHQIRVQFSSRGWPLAGDGKYGLPDDPAEQIALWSHTLAFAHPPTGEQMTFSAPPPETEPWTIFQKGEREP